MGRISRPLLLVALCALLSFVASGCASNGEARDVALQYTDCTGAGCHWFTMSFSRDGTFTFEPVFRNLPAPKVGRAAIDEAFALLPQSEMRRCRARPIQTFNTIVLVVTYRDGSVARCNAPAAITQQQTQSDVALQQYAGELDRRFLTPALTPQLRIFRRALSDGLAQVTLERTPCCPAYTVRFSRSGAATIDAAAGRCMIHARASVALERVQAALYASNIEFAQPEYPRRWKDSPAATLTIADAWHRLRIEGPDELSWGPEFRDAVDRLDQIVLDTQWNPPLPRRRIDGRPLVQASRC